MSESGSPKFLDLKSYRRKRIFDAARLLPVVGVTIMTYPLLFFFVTPDEDHHAVALGLYLFIVWLVLIAAAFVLSRWLSEPTDED